MRKGNIILHIVAIYLYGQIKQNQKSYVFFRDGKENVSGNQVDKDYILLDEGVCLQMLNSRR